MCPCRREPVELSGKQAAGQAGNGQGIVSKSIKHRSTSGPQGAISGQPGPPTPASRDSPWH